MVNRMNDSTLVLTESKSARADKMANVTHDSAMNALNKAKALVMAAWQGTGVATTEQMATYFEVPVDTVKSVVKNNRDELVSDGLKVLRGKDLKDVRSIVDLASDTSQATIWTPRAALRLGMLLRDSEIAKNVRTVLLDVAMQVPSMPVEQVKESLPSRELALETARSVSEIKDLLADTDPRLCQLLVDVAINDAMHSIKALSPANNVRWMGVAEIAELLGLSVNASNRTSLGKFVKAACGATGKQESRICNGRMIPIWCYPYPNAEVEEAIRNFFN